jgi:hypothetical protein
MTIEQCIAQSLKRNRGDLKVYAGSCFTCGGAYYTIGRGLRTEGYCSLPCRGYEGGYVSNGYQYYGDTAEHRTVVEKVIGRPLKRKEEVVHHLNHNKLDNRPKNLVVLTRSENIKLNGNAVTKLFSIIIPEIIEQVTCEELFERM